MQTAPQVFPDYVHPVFESLQDPSKSPYCYRTYILAMSASSHEHAMPRQSTNSVVQDIITSLIIFYAMLLDNPATYTALERRFFHQPCRCVAIFPQLHGFHRAGRGAIHTVTSRLGKENIINLVTFLDFLSEFTDRLIASTQGSSIPSVRSWRRRISHMVEKNASKLTQSFTHLLRHHAKPYIFALFGTLVELSFEMVTAIEKSPAAVSAFDERFHVLVAAEYVQESNRHSPRIDLIFHGAGCISLKFHMVMSSSSSLHRFIACFALGAEQRYDDICRLLSMVSKASQRIQDGTEHDALRLAYFGQDLYRLVGPECRPLSPLITKIIDGGPKLPNGYMVFDTYFHMFDRCSNHLRHSVLGDSNVNKPQFRVMVKLRVKRAEKMLACAMCKASRYCSKECQKESWKGGQIPPREVCPILTKIFCAHQANWGTGHPKDEETVYADAVYTVAFCMTETPFEA
ncbi:hypothetical protein B0H10DRAFT_1967604 [Mycena sp. CBHHK59/15]|nr:hypothetical protein B0H10DRAFT_1967604 [Mycena sp. CBHHK59/15]